MPNYAEIADRAVEIIGSGDLVASNGKPMADPAQYQAAFDVMVAETEAVTKDIDTVEIKKYLILTDKWMGIKVSTEIAAQVTMDALTVFESFRLTDPATGPMVAAKLESMMDALIAANLIDATDKALIMAMGAALSLRWPNLQAGDVQTALRWRSEGEI